MGRGSISPSSRLVLLVVALAVLVILIAALARSGSSSLPSPSSAARPVDPLPSGSPAPAGPTPALASLSPDVFDEPAATASPRRDQPPSSGTPVPSAPAGSLSLSDLLAMLEVAAEDRAGYDREQFPHWVDADGDGCDTRREVLIDEALEPPSIGPGCDLGGGRWVSLYDGVATTDPHTLDIDHVVALAEAWDSGASGWSRDRRTRFANDLDVAWALTAVSAASNRSKSDLDPSAWLPSRASATCDFLGMWLAVKVRWTLSVDSAERAAIRREITRCPQRVDVAPAP